MLLISAEEVSLNSLAINLLVKSDLEFRITTRECSLLAHRHTAGAIDLGAHNELFNVFGADFDKRASDLGAIVAMWLGVANTPVWEDANAIGSIVQDNFIIEGAIKLKNTVKPTQPILMVAARLKAPTTPSASLEKEAPFRQFTCNDPRRAALTKLISFRSAT